LIAFLFYSGSAQLGQRAETTKAVIAWQTATDTLMANCVSKDVVELVLDAIHKANPPIRIAPELEKKLLQPPVLVPQPPIVPQ
jgi:hypothetical protein